MYDPQESWNEKILYMWGTLGNCSFEPAKRKGWYLHCVSNLGKQISCQFLRFPTRKLIVCKCAMNLIGCFSLRVPRVSRPKPSRKQTMPQPRPHLRLCGQNCFRQLAGRTPSAHGEDVGHWRGRCGHAREDVAMKMWPWRCGNSRLNHGWKQKRSRKGNFVYRHPIHDKWPARNPAGCSPGRLRSSAFGSAPGL